MLPLGFLLYGWALAFRAHYIVPPGGTTVAGLSMALSSLLLET